ncbi:tight junction protein ZO-3 isoform X1 [Salmo salar]|uniref:Tight junction protein ZO-3 isoform X1 n=2 Tax=Salmo salar TaxID=8030 RepID=A0A1S3MN24_SALSA|nr:tight junction protein ZO-3 isoform X1 [Salmo salar]|eukprot:XP_014004211.1 PREDICTED: tight junction protein ZO-3-like isoform X1 [Salmo salar]
MNLTRALKLVTYSVTPPTPEMEELTIFEQHTITLGKDSKMGFGFAISGGRDQPNPDSGDTAVIVSDVVRNGPAMGRLFVRDQIVMVNGVSMDNVYSTFTIQNLKSCGKTANITVKRPRRIQLPASTRPSRAASYSNLLDQDPPQRPRRYSDGSDQAHKADRYRAPSSTLDRNGTAHALPLSSGYKRLPQQAFPEKPVKATLLKKKLTDEYGLKLGSQIFIKHMTETGLAAKEGTLQEGDLILKINGMTTENLSLLETKHLVEKSRGKLTMMVLRDDRKFLVSIPEVQDSASNSEEDHNSSSELEDISDLDTDIPTPRNRVSRSATRERRTRRRAEPPLVAKSRDPSPVRSTLSRPVAKAYPSHRAPSESESDRSASPTPVRKDSPDHANKYRTISGLSTLPNPKASPAVFDWAAPRSSRPSSSTLRPRKVVSESDSDRSASPPPRRGESSRVTEDHSRYRVLPNLPHPRTLRASPITIRQDPPRRVSSPVKAPLPDSESESDSSSGPAHSQDSRSRYRATPLVAMLPQVEPPKWKAPSVTMSNPAKGRSGSESEASYASVPRRESVDSGGFSSRVSKNRYRALLEIKSSPAPVVRQDPPRQGITPSSPVSGSSDSDRTPSPPRRSGSTDVESNHSIPHGANGNVRTGISMKSNPPVYSKTEEPLYSLPPDSVPTPSLGSDLNTVSFVKERSVGLRLVGGNDVGIFVDGVQPNSPAQEQGMKEGDQIMQVNGVDFGYFNREEAVMFLINIKRGELVDIRTQNKMDIYKKILKSNLGDSFYVRTHYDNEVEGNIGLAFTRGEVFRVVDTMHRGKLGRWLAIRMGNDLHELEKGTIPNQVRAETLASMEQAQWASEEGDRQVSGPRAEFWKLRGLRGAKKNLRRTRDDLLQLTIQGKFPAYERVLLRKANFKWPIVIMGPLNDVAMEKLAREMPDEYEVAEMAPRRSGADTTSTVIKLDTVRRIAEKNKHPLLDITPTAVERLNYIQYHPMVLFLDPHSRKDVKAMRQRMCPNSNKSSRRLYTQALKMRKYCSHLFTARIDLQPSSNVWYETLKDKIRHQQDKPVWDSQVMLEGGGEEELDALDRTHSDYLSAASELEDTDGEAFTDGEVYTDNEDLEEPFDPSNHPRMSRLTALARSSEPASEYHSPGHSPEPLREVPPLMHVSEHRSTRRPSDSPPHVDVADDTRPYHSFSDSDFRAIDQAAPTTPSDTPPDFIAPDPRVSVPEPPSAELLPENPPAVTLSVIERKLQQTRVAESQERKASPSFIVLAHHQAVQTRRTCIRGSDSSDNEETDDIEWGPATDL